jgi:hypothetical protein
LLQGPGPEGTDDPGKGPQGGPSGPKGPKEGSQKGRVPERKKPSKGRCGLSRRKKRKEEKKSNHLKYVELL